MRSGTPSRDAILMVLWIVQAAMRLTIEQKRRLVDEWHRRQELSRLSALQRAPMLGKLEVQMLRDDSHSMERVMLVRLSLPLPA